MAAPKTGYLVGSIEGRCGVKYFDCTGAQQKTNYDFNFKCHRKEEQVTLKATVWAVNGFTFNQKYNTFASYGADGTIVTWNKDNKSKLKASLDFG